MYAKRLGVATILAVVIFGAVYGAATSLGISGVKAVGGGGVSVPSPPDVTKVVFLIDSTDYWLVDKVVIYLAGTMTGHAYVEITDSTGAVIATGSEWFSATEVTVDFAPNVPARDVCDIHIVLLEE